MTGKTTSWWMSLHDGYLERFSSSLPDRTVTLNVRIDHLGDHNAQGSHFEIRLNIVRVVHVAAWESWGALDPQEPETYNLALLQGRMISIEVEDFETSGLRIVDAAVCETSAGELVWPQVTSTEKGTPVSLLTIDVDGSESSDLGDRGIAVVFDTAEVFRDGRPITVGELLALGESHWQKFHEHAEQLKA